jgi:LemA protein
MMRPHRPSRKETAMKKFGCLIAAVVVILIFGLYLVGVYNGLVGSEQAVEAQWAQVQNVYQRRADLVPNLVASVKGAANFEQSTLTAVIQARSQATQMTPAATQEILNDPAKFAQYQKAQDGLSSALSRLMVVVEQYPQLKAVQAFQDLMVQLEGTENRIAVERRSFNEVAQTYNTKIRRFPAALFASMMGFQPRPYFQATAGADVAPKVDFGTTATPGH